MRLRVVPFHTQAALAVYEQDFATAITIIRSNCFPTYGSLRDELIQLWHTAQRQKAEHDKGSGLTKMVNACATHRAALPAMCIPSPVSNTSHLDLCCDRSSSGCVRSFGATVIALTARCRTDASTAHPTSATRTEPGSLRSCGERPKHMQIQARETVALETRGSDCGRRSLRGRDVV
jgi:hypothetical protein